MSSKYIFELKLLKAFLSQKFIPEETVSCQGLLQNSTENSTCNKIYGRIISSSKDTIPEELARGRETAFIFGEDFIFSLIMEKIDSDGYCVLLTLGLTPEHIKMKLHTLNEKYWLLLFIVQSSLTIQNVITNEIHQTYPATWEGVTSMVKCHYPKAYQDLMEHFSEITEKSCSYFEKLSGIAFLKCLELRDEQHAMYPYMSYCRYLKCPEPRTSWQCRLFLYCEFRLLDKFVGNGRTLKEDNSYGPIEYITNNFKLNSFVPSNIFLAPINVNLPIN